MSTKNKTKPRLFDSIFDVVLKHPFIFTALLCLLLFPMGFANAENVTTPSVIFEMIIWLGILSALFVVGKPSGNSKVNIYLAISSAVIIIVFSLLVSENKSNSMMMSAPAAAIVIQLAVVLFHEKKLDADKIVILMIVMGVVLRYCYCLKYSSAEMQHDQGTFDGSAGHLSYISYWYKNGLKLPDFDVSDTPNYIHWQYYHPPLHHILMACGMKVLSFFGMTDEWAREAVQILPMTYSALSMVACYRIFKLVKLGGAGLVAAMAIPCFYRTFIIWSGSYNNDMLCAMFMLLSMMLTLKWYYKPTLLNILPIAVCVGCGMMAKLSGWMVAPAIALVFLWKFIQNIKKPLPFIGQYAAFGAVSVPLGLWWGIRNYLEFGTPITYVPDLKSASMSVEQIPVAQRLFDFSFFQFDYPFMAFKGHGAPYNEFNPAFGLFKTSLFDEYHKPEGTHGVEMMLVVMAALLALLGIIGLIYMLVKKNNGIDLPVKAFFAVVFLTIIISYYLFCFQFPYVCTENIRYCIPVIPILAMGLGFLVNAAGKALKKQ